MIISKLRHMSDSSDFVALLNEVEVHSVVGRKMLMSTDFSSDKAYLNKEFDNVEYVIDLLDNAGNNKSIDELYSIFCEIKDISKTFENLQNEQLLSDIDLYEIKYFTFWAQKMFYIVNSVISRFRLEDSDKFDDIMKLLDPENTRVPTFYIYDSYSKELTMLRRKEKEVEDENDLATIQSQIFIIERNVRQSLTNKLCPYVEFLVNVMNKIAYIDILLSKAEFTKRFNLTRPEISESVSIYKGIFNPLLRQQFEKQGSVYQPINVSFDKNPILITGINMGGKTLLLRTLYVSQMLCQYGFYVPASKATIMLVDDIMCSFTDEQDQQQGLSSFAAEMNKVNNIISVIYKNPNVLVLIDELARTTNPREGASIVEAMLDVLQEYKVSAFITTHYDVSTTCKRLKVKGLREDVDISRLVSKNISSFDTKSLKSIQKMIDYDLEEDNNSTTTNEAIRIAQMLGVSDVLISKAKEKLKK